MNDEACPECGMAHVQHVARMKAAEAEAERLRDALGRAREFIFDSWSGYEVEKPGCLNVVDRALGITP